VPYAQYAGKTNGMSVVKLLSVNNSASVILTNNTLYPSQFYTQEYTAGAGEIAVIQFATSFEAVNQHSVVINMNVGVSENNGFFSVNSVAQDIRLAITSGYGGVMNTNAILPLTAGKTYKFSPAFFIGSGSIGYFLKVNGTVMILKQ
jgi:hypothetical protein